MRIIVRNDYYFTNGIQTITSVLMSSSDLNITRFNNSNGFEKHNSINKWKNWIS